MLNIIVAIYIYRSFVLRDPVVNSIKRLQAAGIARGCPLSPFLFIIVHSAIIYDVDNIMIGLRDVIREPN
eukprot:8761957-Pyramimonas_sp.AAC.1